MDEQNKSNIPNEQVPSGFDSVTNITPKENDKFNPTPMFASMNNNADNKDDAVPTETPKSAPVNEVTDSEPEVKVSGTEDTQKSDTVIGAHDFIPSGTYSYSAAKGDLKSSAFETPDINPKPEEPVFQTTENKDYKPYSPIPPIPQKPKKDKEPKKYGVGVVVLSSILAAIIGMFGGIMALKYYPTLDTDTNTTSSVTEQTSPQTQTTIKVDESVNSSIEAVAKKAGPSIIGIRTTAAVTNFFGGQSEATEEGSGIIYTSNGYIITNYHVIQSAVESSDSKVEVFLPDDTETALTASVVGYNISSDLAVVKINKSNLPAIEFADSDKLNVGQYAIAIGNPGGLEFIGSVSYGVISGLNRSVAVGTGDTMSLIQTDAAINPGNSGGALVDIEGKLIGVNSVKLVSESYEGMGFAIPSNTVKEICDNIIAKQNEPTPYIGIQISQNYTADQLAALGFPTGAVVVDVIEGGPANESGIQRGDIITEFNGKTIDSYTDLDDAIAQCKPGDSVTVKLYRAGRFYSTSINVEANNAQ